MDILSYLIGKNTASGGGGGTSYDWSNVEVSNSDVPNYDTIEQNSYNYAVQIYNNWNSTLTDLSSKYKNDTDLIVFPSVYTNNATNTNSMFSGCVSLATVGNIDISKVTDAGKMFENCGNLTKVPNLSFAKMKTCESMFKNCVKLKSYGNITYSSSQNVTSSTGVFEGCTALESVGTITLPTDGLNKPNLASWFKYCSSLKKAPTIVNSQRCQNYSMMFSGCTNLKDIPAYNMSGLQSGIGNYIQNCPSLTNDSLNNVMASLSTASGYSSTKTLKAIGFSESQANTCTTLSNWSDLEDAGWTTGY